MSCWELAVVIALHCDCIIQIISTYPHYIDKVNIVEQFYLYLLAIYIFMVDSNAERALGFLWSFLEHDALLLLPIGIVDSTANRFITECVTACLSFFACTHSCCLRRTVAVVMHRQLEERFRHGIRFCSLVVSCRVSTGALRLYMRILKWVGALHPCVAHAMFDYTVNELSILCTCSMQVMNYRYTDKSTMPPCN